MKTLPLLLITGTIVLAGAGTANAETFCVGGGFRCAGTAVPTLQAALLAAETAPGADEVVIGDKGEPFVGPFVYPTKAFQLEPVEIRGIGNPVLTAAPGESVLTAVAAKIEGVDVLTPPGGTGLGLVDSTVRDVTVRGAGDVGVEATSEDVRAERLRVDGPDIGVLGQDFADLDISHSRITAARTGVATRGLTTLRSSVVGTTGANGVGVNGTGGGLDLDHVTVAGTGSAALKLTSVDIAGRANIQSSVFAGYDRGVLRDTSENGTPYPLAIRDSVWESSHDLLGDATSGPFKEAGNAHVDPQLVGGGDLRPRGSSAAIDRDTLTDGRYTDVDDVATVGARADAGAFEYRRRAPSIDAATVPGAGAVGAALAFSATASDPDGDRLQITWAFDDNDVAAGAQATHAFVAPGLHAVTLRVRDEAGLEATRSFRVAVGGDATAPVLSGVRLSKRRATLPRVGGVRLRFQLSEAARVRIVARGRAFKVAGEAGDNAVPLRRLKIRRAGRLAIAVRAVDAAGNRSLRRVVKLAVKPR
jgi:PKD domain